MRFFHETLLSVERSIPMQHLSTASQELFKRSPDETFSSVAALSNHCQQERNSSSVLWQSPERFNARSLDSRTLVLAESENFHLRQESGSIGPTIDAAQQPRIGNDGSQSYPMNDWSFGQLCRLAGVEKRTINRLTAGTASRVFEETLPRGNKPLQVFTIDEQVRSIHGSSYTRLHNSEVLDVVLDAADGFDAPPKGFNGATGLYCGEQDMFCFLIDPTGWIEINDEAFAPGFFVWNSEVGRRTLGIQTFWFQQICQNHIVWDAVEVFDLKRKHTANVHRGLGEIRSAIQRLTSRRDERRDQFAEIIKRAMDSRFEDADDAYKAVMKIGVGQRLAKQAVELVQQNGRLTIFSMVDALTRLSGKIANAGDRNEVDQQVGQLLTLAV
jgi:hypothetical protein